MRNFDGILHLAIVYVILIILSLLGLFPLYVTLIMAIVVSVINDGGLRKVFIWTIVPMSIFEDIINIQLLGSTLLMSIVAIFLVLAISKMISDTVLKLLVSMVSGHIIGIILYLLINLIFLKKGFDFSYIWDCWGSIIIGVIVGLIYSKVFSKSLSKVKV